MKMRAFRDMHHVVLWKLIDVSVVSIAYIRTIMEAYSPLKRWPTSTRLHGVISH
jgi:hypothetical protein